MSDIKWADGTRLWLVDRDKRDRITGLKEVDVDSIREMVQVGGDVHYVQYVEGEPWVWVLARDLLMSAPEGIRLPFSAHVSKGDPAAVLGRVHDAGGGMVTFSVADDTASYPKPGQEGVWISPEVYSRLCDAQAARSGVEENPDDHVRAIVHEEINAAVTRWNHDLRRRP